MLFPFISVLVYILELHLSTVKIDSLFYFLVNVHVHLDGEHVHTRKTSIPETERGLPNKRRLFMVSENSSWEANRNIIDKFCNSNCLCDRSLTSKMTGWGVVMTGHILQGVPKKIGPLSSSEFSDLGGVFLGVKNNSKNFGNKNNSRFFSKILSKWTLFSSKPSNFLEF